MAILAMIGHGQDGRGTAGAGQPWNELPGSFVPIKCILWMTRGVTRHGQLATRDTLPNIVYRQFCGRRRFYLLGLGVVVGSTWQRHFSTHRGAEPLRMGTPGRAPRVSPLLTRD